MRWFHAHPNWSIGIFICFHVIVWTIVNTLIHPTVHFDMVEQVIQGKQFLYSGYKHPPLSFWLPAAFFSVFPISNIAYNLLAQLNIGFALLGVWLLAKRLLAQPMAAVALLLVASMPLYIIHAAKLNANSIQIAVWVWAMYCAVCALATNRNRYWIGLGLFAALALLGKYFAVTMLLGMAGFFVATQAGRRCLRSYKPYLALVVFFALVLPHFYNWFEQAASGYAFARANAGTPNEGRLDAIKFFFTSGYIYNLILLIVVTLLVKRNMFFKLLWAGKPFAIHPADTNQQLLWWCICAPWLIASVVALLFDFHISSLWGMPFWAALPVYLLYGETSKRQLSIGKILLFVCLWYVFIAGIVLAAASVKPTKSDYHLPAVAAAALLEQTWQQEQSTQQPQWIVGSRFAEFIALYAFAGKLTYNPAKPQGSGLVVCQVQDTNCCTHTQTATQDAVRLCKQSLSHASVLTIAADKNAFANTTAATLLYSFVPKAQPNYEQ